MPTGRFAPSPTGELHLGNLRTALVAWLFARSQSAFVVRMEDLDPGAVRADLMDGQLADLAAIGLDWDGPVVRQSERRDRYDAAIGQLVAAGLTYPCWCSRREIREAASAPAPDFAEGAYPGTCRDLEGREKERLVASGRRPALRLRAGSARHSFVDALAGPFSGAVDDIVLRRADGTPAYNLAVVVDDAAQGIEQVVRGDDLLSSTPRQLHLAGLLGLAAPSYAHVPMVLGADGVRLAKRHGAVTLADLAAAGVPADEVLGRIAVSLGLARTGEAVTTGQLVGRFDPALIPRDPWIIR
jgi:glutamyl-tRNA synthetase